MSNDFKFDKEEIDSLCDLAWREPPEEPFADEEQIKRFIVKIEDAINGYPSYCDMPGTAESRRKLQAARKTAQKLYEQLIYPCETLKFLQDSVSYMNVDCLMPPNSVELGLSLGKIGFLIDYQLELLKGKRTSTIGLALGRFTAILVCGYFFEFAEWPPIAERKKPRPEKERPLQNPFTHFLDHALHALVTAGHLGPNDVPRDTKNLTRKAVKHFQHFFEAMLNARTNTEMV